MRGSLLCSGIDSFYVFFRRLLTILTASMGLIGRILRRFREPPLKSITEELSENCASAFESLPVEIVQRIFSYTPESILAIRQVSRMLRFRADEYARERESIPYVEVVHIGPIHLMDVQAPSRMMLIKRRVLRRVPWNLTSPALIRILSGDKPEAFHVLANIAKCWSNLFELRVNLQGKEFSRRFIRRSYLHITNNTYQIRVKIGDVNTMEMLGRCIGERIKHVAIDGFGKERAMPANLALLHEHSIDQLTIRISGLNDDVARNLLETVREKKVNTLEMAVHYVTCTDTANLLLELSTLLYSLRIETLSIFNSDKFLNIPNNVWANVFPEMLSRKLEKLSILKYGDFLDLESAMTIGKRLSNIEKEIWFEALFRKANFNFEFQKNNNSAQMQSYPSTFDIPFLYSALRVMPRSRKTDREPKQTTICRFGDERIRIFY